MQPLLSILICSLESRIGMLGELTRNIHEQIDKSNANGKVEVIINMDNKQKTTGKKRQELLEQANGVGISFADDDDFLYDCYVEEMLKAVESGADCAAINGIITTNGKNQIEWRISKDYDNVTIKENGKSIYLRHTNHITWVRRELALRAGFNDVSNGEDKFYSDRLRGILKTEYKIIPPMYHYRFSTHNKTYK